MHELRMLPYYSVFDDLKFNVNGTTVTLSGDVVNPSVKSDAESAAKHVKGVTNVVDNINVLPPIARRRSHSSRRISRDL